MNNLIYLAILVIDIVVILDIFKQSWDMGKKIIWTLIVLIFPVVGPIIYWLIARK
jgi:hypothetical protein